MPNDLEGVGRQELFEEVADDGVRWVFAVLVDGAWEVTRDEVVVATGDGYGPSLDAGVDAFLRAIRLGFVPESSQGLGGFLAGEEVTTLPV